MVRRRTVGGLDRLADVSNPGTAAISAKTRAVATRTLPSGSRRLGASSEVAPHPTASVRSEPDASGRCDVTTARVTVGGYHDLRLSQVSRWQLRALWRDAL